MTPPAATAAATRAPGRRATAAPRPRAVPRRHTRRPPSVRRVSGPIRGVAAGAGGAATSVALPLGARALHGIAALPDRAIVERMVRGRAWIAVVGTLLIGLVFLQVTLLGMNAGIGTAVERSAALDRANGELRANVSRLSAGERVQAIAADDGMVMPSAGQVQYGRARTARDARVAARALRDGDFAPGSTPAPLPALDTSEQPTLASAAPTSITPTSTTTVAPVGATTPGATSAAPTQTTPTTPSYAPAPVAVAPVPAAAPQTAAPQVSATSSAGGVSAGGATAATGG